MRPRHAAATSKRSAERGSPPASELPIEPVPTEQRSVPATHNPDRRAQLARAHAARVEALAARERLAEILESIRDAFLAVDEGWTLTYANGEAERLFGVGREEILGRPLLSALPPLRASEPHQKLERVMIERVPVSFDLEGRAPRTWFAAHAYPSADGISIHLHDVSERRRAEEALRFLVEAGAALVGTLDRSELVQRAARLCVPPLGDWCLAVALEGGEEGAAMEAAAIEPERAERLLAIVRSEQGKPSAWTGLLRDAVDSREPVVVTGVAPQDPLSGIVTGPVLLVPLAAHEDPQGALLLGRGEEREPWGEEERRAAASLGRRLATALESARLYAAARRATRLRDDVLAIVAHDLRNPLNAITMGASTLSLAAERGPTSPILATGTRAILKAADGMNRLIGDLLDAARLEAGWAPREKAPIAVARLLESALEPFRDRADSLGLRLELDVAEDANGEVVVDEARMLQVLANLVDNACKFTPSGGTVRVRAERVGDEILLSVVDTGPGIPADAMGHLFDRFWQAKAAGRAGAGLGLFIAKRIVDGHGGRIWAESELGRGSAFRIALPEGGGSSR